MNATDKKMAAELIGSKREVPKLSKANLRLLRMAAQVQEAYGIWRLVDRDNARLNDKMDDIRAQYP